MPHRRILSFWFPRLGAERLLRREEGARDRPFAVVRDTGQMQVLSSLSASAEAAGLVRGQPLRDAQAVCPELVTRLRNPQAEAAFLGVLARWAGRFSPWVAEEPPAGLMLDLTGCAHLFGGEDRLLAQAQAECEAVGLTLCAGIADTVGAAWALARYAGRAQAAHRSGDAIDQEARATRSRAVKRRHWERGGPAPQLPEAQALAARIAPPGQAHGALAPLPVAALRLEPEVVAGLSRLGLRRIGDLAGQPRAALARRFGRGLVMRLDQAFGAASEPISPAKPTRPYAVRLSLPDPIGLEEDVMAAIDRLLPALCARLEAAGLGARTLRLQLMRCDGSIGWADVGLARPSAEADRIRPLLAMKVPEIEAGFGFDVVRIEAVQVEATSGTRAAGHLDAGRRVAQQMQADTAIDDLIGRLGARVGLERITRVLPGDSHIPEKTANVVAAAWAGPHEGDWPAPPAPRPLILWRPEPVAAPEEPHVPPVFRWRGRTRQVAMAAGPERIAPEWWLDMPDWRSGTRDYWRVTCTDGARLWLYFAHGGTMSAGWFCHGGFA